MKRQLSYLAGAILGMGMSVASADPVTLTNAQMDDVTAGVGFTSETFITKLVQIQELIEEQKLAFFFVDVDVSGFSAVAEAEADAEGPNADAQTFTFAEIEPRNGTWRANSLAKSIALVDPRPIGSRPGAPAPAP